MLVACQSKPAAPTADAAPAAPAVLAKVGAAATLPEAELSALLERWLAAQNGGQLAQYDALYASKFHGVKRAGTRETRFARKDWLADRERMFKKPMTVEARDVVYRPASSSAEIELTQHFASGNFSDVGKKRLLVVREGKELKIAQEEMLSSRELTGRTALDKAFDLHFLLALESGLYIVLESTGDQGPKRPARRETEREPMADRLSTSITLTDAELSEAQRAFRGQRMRTDTGCTGQVSSFLLLSRVVPHFGTYAAWENREGDQAQGALDEQQVNDAAFELGQKMVVAQLEGCTEGRYAQRESTAPPAKAEHSSEPALIERALAAYGRRPEVLAHQQDFLSQVEGAQGLWWRGSVRADVFRHPLSRQTLVSVRGNWPGDGCSDFGASEWLVFELRGKKLVPIHSAAEDPEIGEALDVNGDGRLEFLNTGLGFGTDMVLQSPDADGPYQALTYSFQDCPC